MQNAEINKTLFKDLLFLNSKKLTVYFKNYDKDISIHIIASKKIISPI